MGRGYPDYFGNSIFLKYGTAKEISTTVVIPGTVETTVFDVAAKGIGYGGWLRTSGANAHSDDDVKIIIDGTTIFNLHWRSMKLRSLEIANHPLIRLISYDTATPDYAAAFGNNIPFENQFKITFTPHGAAAVILRYAFYYAEVE